MWAFGEAPRAFRAFAEAPRVRQFRDNRIFTSALGTERGESPKKRLEPKLHHPAPPRKALAIGVFATNSPRSFLKHPEAPWRQRLEGISKARGGAGQPLPGLIFRAGKKRWSTIVRHLKQNNNYTKYIFVYDLQDQI
jgi:hypothetical protein